MGLVKVYLQRLCICNRWSWSMIRLAFVYDKDIKFLKIKEVTLFKS